MLLLVIMSQQQGLLFLRLAVQGHTQIRQERNPAILYPRAISQARQEVRRILHARQGLIRLAVQFPASLTQLEHIRVLLLLSQRFVLRACTPVYLLQRLVCPFPPVRFLVRVLRLLLNALQHHTRQLLGIRLVSLPPREATVPDWDR